MQNDKLTTVFVVDDDTDFRDSLVFLLESAGYQVLGFSSAQALLDGYRGEAGCLLLDVRMPEINGLRLQQILAERKINLPTVIITGHGDIPMAVGAMKNGAMDFIEKPFEDDVILSRVEHALTQASRQLHAQEKFKQVLDCYEQLSRREREVMALVVDGLPNREVAQTLGISPKTVEIHRSRVMSKMQADNLANLVHKASLLSQ
ncbi:Transcriptional regulatory protein fixJ [Vibrio nigripulchritudo SFn27]|uniref:Transcriptional regulatory protein fixJ n=1 Tax=Vibrio nigripulchritudo TaxID=28173 RepID=U4K384_9VIBR|nr:response regulator [Vibrio nigripulchritudo]CCN83823.1 Transcriptional regulatory protein fixJ [Vibrio nigripulchritudo BLFn1]CCN87169.1 Transcriptional regulatory protein fixJ [Vibrio nigripulchritudo SFn27]CCN94525.1 Transcriptional regulatory protein fixJ [Vibrio nigripulchritudo ENn2]CCO40909.1 Transcriptional regulatory protein fixJ [Vibrio nigripulchritudo SFn135]CCO54988.1 Transcriptional regulatory protein fixJ [Vibrio nigripulchritudo Wn13]